ncbi:MAG: hypothetical protein V8T87_14420 [Victivallales bacterium]
MGMVDALSPLKIRSATSPPRVPSAAGDENAADGTGVQLIPLTARIIPLNFSGRFRRTPFASENSSLTLLHE